MTRETEDNIESFWEYNVQFNHTVHMTRIQGNNTAAGRGPEYPGIATELPDPQSS